MISENIDSISVFSKYEKIWNQVNDLLLLASLTWDLILCKKNFQHIQEFEFTVKIFNAISRRDIWNWFDWPTYCTLYGKIPGILLFTTIVPDILIDNRLNHQTYDLF